MSYFCQATSAFKSCLKISLKSTQSRKLSVKTLASASVSILQHRKRDKACRAQRQIFRLSLTFHIPSIVNSNCMCLVCDRHSMYMYTPYWGRYGAWISLILILSLDSLGVKSQSVLKVSFSSLRSDYCMHMWIAFQAFNNSAGFSKCQHSQAQLVGTVSL